MHDCLEELDLLKLLAVSREIDLYDAQITILRMKLQEASRVNAALHTMLRDKYGLTERDQIDAATGQIARHQVVEAPTSSELSRGQ
jgi:hypothetical protein